MDEDFSFTDHMKALNKSAFWHLGIIAKDFDSGYSGHLQQQNAAAAILTN